MNPPPPASSTRFDCLPLALGVSAILLSFIYYLERSGLLVPHSFERFVQHHLDSCGIASFVLAVTGMILGLYFGRGGRKARVVSWGTLTSVAAALAQLALPL
jgi:hypothetical protein